MNLPQNSANVKCIYNLAGAIHLKKGEQQYVSVQGTVVLIGMVREQLNEEYKWLICWEIPQF